MMEGALMQDYVKIGEERFIEEDKSLCGVFK